MTERKPPGVSFESWVDRQIREATDRGEFDNLPGAGKPLPGYGGADDENWWVHSYLRREGVPGEDLLPTPLRLRKEIERLPDTVRELTSEQQVHDVVEELNRRIKDYWRSPSPGPQVPVRLVNAQTVVERWRAYRLTAARRTAATVPAMAPRPAPWWRRIAGRHRTSG